MGFTLAQWASHGSFKSVTFEMSLQHTVASIVAFCVASWAARHARAQLATVWNPDAKSTPGCRTYHTRSYEIIISLNLALQHSLTFM
jgi:hypothetical protein